MSWSFDPAAGRLSGWTKAPSNQKSRLFTRALNPRPTRLPDLPQKLSQAVGQLQTHIVCVRGIDLNFIQQPAHAARLLGAEQVALARTPAHDLAGGSDLEALGGAAMRLGFQFLVLLHDILLN